MKLFKVDFHKTSLRPVAPFMLAGKAVLAETRLCSTASHDSENSRVKHIAVAKLRFMLSLVGPTEPSVCFRVQCVSGNIVSHGGPIPGISKYPALFIPVKVQNTR